MVNDGHCREISCTWILWAMSAYTTLVEFWYLGGGFNEFLDVHPENWGRWSNLTDTFQRVWNHQLVTDISDYTTLVEGSFHIDVVWKKDFPDWWQESLCPKIWGIRQTLTILLTSPISEKRNESFNANRHGIAVCGVSLSSLAFLLVPLGKQMDSPFKK